MAAASCDFLVVELPNPLNPRENLEWGVGFSRIRMPLELASVFGQDGGCEALDTDTGNITLTGSSTAKTFAIFNCLLSTVGFIGITLLTCKTKIAKRRDYIWLTMRICMYISLYCAIFSFYLQESETCDVYSCSLGGMAIAQIVNVILLIFVCAMLFIMDAGSGPASDICFQSAVDFTSGNIRIRSQNLAK